MIPWSDDKSFRLVSGSRADNEVQAAVRRSKTSVLLRRERNVSDRTC
jgi:hypothetical protein